LLLVRREVQSAMLSASDAAGDVRPRAGPIGSGSEPLCWHEGRLVHIDSFAVVFRYDEVPR
jgi:hypothetical protein